MDDAPAQEGQTSKGPEGPASRERRTGAIRSRSATTACRRWRPASSRPANRGRSYCDDPSHQARWQDLDPALFPDKPISKKPAETRMGKGKGNPEAWVAPVKRGRILYEMEGVNPEIAREALRSRGPQAADSHALRDARGTDDEWQSN